MINRILTYLIFILLTTSCATHYGTIEGTQITPTTKGITYKDKVYGYASCEYIFFIGGMGKQGLADQAMTNLQMSVNLEDGEYLDNFTINHKKLYLAPLYIRHEVLISADKIQSMDSFPVRYDSTYKGHLANSKTVSTPFSNNQKVYSVKNRKNSNPNPGVVVEPGTDDSKVLLSGNYGGAEVRLIDNSELFKRNSSSSVHSLINYAEKDSIFYQTSNKSPDHYISGELLGSNGSHLLIRHGSDIEIVHKNRMIVEDHLQENEANLNEIMISLLRQGAKNEPVMYRTGSKQMKSVSLLKVLDNSVIIEQEGEEEIEVPISDLYTRRNWLITNTHKFSFQEFYRDSNLLFYTSPKADPIEVKVVGFRYYNVLVETEDGILKEIPIGKLFPG